ncbi:MAG TPA: NIPSNAP family protein [Burkholderiales bacterium]|nr:NIPSNAP family protein [Burkholderiales bacterium]
MLYELRTYLVGTGRTADMDAMMSRDCTPVFRRHGIPRPIGAWNASAGPRLPAYVWIVPWPSLEERNKGWAAFGADPEWQAIRRKAHEKSELTARIDTHFMAAWPQATPAAGADLSTGAAEADLWLLRVHAGLGGAARKAFLECDRPVLESLGARVDAAFDVLTGEELPVVAVLIRWPQAGRRAELLAKYEASEQVRAAREAEHAAHGVDLFPSCDRYALTPASAFGR